MREIIGNTTTTPYPHPDWNQTDPTKADYIKNKPPIITNEGGMMTVGSGLVMDDCISYAENAVALGENTRAGSRAFGLLGYDADAQTYTLDSTEGIEVGDYYSIYFRFRRTKYGQVTAIDGDVITVDPCFIPNVSDAEKEEYLPTAYIYIVGKPDIGTLVIGETSYAIGEETVAAEKQSDVGGYGSISDGRYAFTRGLYNITGYASATFGQDNENLGLKGFIGGGQGNYVGPTVERAAIFNHLNQVLANDGFAAGIGNIVDAIAQAKFGKYSRTTSAYFAVGNGTNDENRSNAFAVFQDGHAEVQSVGSSNMSVTNKKFVMEAIDQAIEGIINGAPGAYDTFKEIADWITNDETGAASLISRVSQAEEDIINANISVKTLSENKVDKVTNKTGTVGVLAVAKNGNAPYVVKSTQDGGSGNPDTFVRRDPKGHLRATSSVTPETDWTKFNSYDAMPRSYIDEKLSGYVTNEKLNEVANTTVLSGGYYPDMSVGHAVKATCDGFGRIIADTYTTNAQMSDVVNLKFKSAGGISLGTTQGGTHQQRNYIDLEEGVYFVHIYGARDSSNNINIIAPLYLSRSYTSTHVTTPIAVSSNAVVTLSYYYRANDAVYQNLFDIILKASDLSSCELTAEIL